MRHWIGQRLRSHLVTARAWARLRRLRHGARRGRVAMFHVGRCGSTVLGGLLAQHPRVSWGSELFDEVHQRFPGFRATPEWTRAVIELGTWRDGRDWFGFETKSNHLHASYTGMPVPDYVALLERIGFDRFVVLRRRNLLRVVASVSVGFRQQRWHQAGTASGPQTVALDLANLWGTGLSLVQVLDWFSQYYRDLDDALRGKQVLALCYEDDIEADPRVAYRKMCEFLDIAPEPVEVRLARTNPFPLRELIGNFSEVSAALGGTAHAWMLES